MSESNLDPIIRELVGAHRKFLPVMLSVSQILNRRNEKAQEFASDLALFTHDWKQKNLPVDEKADFLVTVDRLSKLVYPGFVDRVMHPELEVGGHASYNITSVARWLHPDQGKSVTGKEIYDTLRESGAISRCLNLRDGQAISRMGVRRFRRLFDGQSPFLWGSVVQDNTGYLLVPYLHDAFDEIEVGWEFLESRFTMKYPALCFMN